VRIFIAGASGLIGIRLVAPLVSAGHVVAGMTRSPGKAARLSELGAEPVICDVFDAEALNRAVGAFRPDVVFHQLTDLPDDAGASRSSGTATTGCARRGPVACWPPPRRPGPGGSSRRASRGSCLS